MVILTRLNQKNYAVVVGGILWNGQHNEKSAEN